MLEEVHKRALWDVIVIGGGATGLWCALDACTRGFSVLLLEKGDFACATSSKSTKLFHGGLRYLKQGHLALVREALQEREILFKNASHLVTRRPFLIPCYHLFDRLFYSLGMQVYDLFSGGASEHHHLNRKECQKFFPNLISEHLQGGCFFSDGQFDDARFAIELAKSLVEHGGFLLNYAPVQSLIKENGYINGVLVTDLIGKEELEIHGRTIINATGIYIDEIRKMDDPLSPPLLSFSRGSHIVLDSHFLLGESALIIPKTPDKRILFLIPWLGKVLVGTTDIPVETLPSEPKPTKEEVDFLLHQAGEYLHQKPTAKDVLSAFAGIRPLVRGKGPTSKLLRSHKNFESASGLITIAGGKWTTARKMAEDTLNYAIRRHDLEEAPCRTKSLLIHQTAVHPIKELFDPRLPLTHGDVLIGIHEEMAYFLTDILARRSRCLFLHREATLKIAPTVAHFMAKELQKKEEWALQEIRNFTSFSENYCC
jgi:glycerol-3-phosphate dehydrogenase